jgi:hypothetical protein
MADEPAREEAPPDAAFAWHVASRLGEIEGEARANAFRALGVLLFYGLELLAYHGETLGLPFSYARPVDQHRAISLIAAAWTLMAVVVDALIRRRLAPWGLPYASTGADVALLTALLAVSEGPASPFVVGYFLVLGLAGLRLSLPLVRFATALAAAGWVVLLGIAKGAGKDLPPRYHQALLLCSIVFAGLLLGQAVRRARKVAEEYAERRASPPA